MRKIFEIYKEYGCIIFALGVILTFLFVGAIYALIGFVFMTLFNWIAPIYWANAPELTLWESIGTIMLILIVGSLFKAIVIDE